MCICNIYVLVCQLGMYIVYVYVPVCICNIFVPVYLYRYEIPGAKVQHTMYSLVLLSFTSCVCVCVFFFFSLEAVHYDRTPPEGLRSANKAFAKSAGKFFFFSFFSLLLRKSLRG